MERSRFFLGDVRSLFSGKVRSRFLGDERSLLVGKCDRVLVGRRAISFWEWSDRRREGAIAILLRRWAIK